MPIKELSVEQRIKQAIKDVEEAMLENVLANRAETDAQVRRRKAHFTSQKANERLNSLRSELMEIVI